MYSSLIMLSPLLVLPFYPQELNQGLPFIIFAALMAALGFIFRFLIGSKDSGDLDLDESGIVVFLSWLIFCVFSAFPLMKLVPLNFTQAMFESVSGWTTTGLSVVDSDNASHIVLMWRSIMQLCGGAGLAIIMVASITGVAGTGLYTAEGKGSQMKPHVKDSARIVLGIYSGYIVLGTISYMVAGMTLFEALIHTFAAISTGGFSTHNANIGWWDSPSLEAVSIVLMILGNINFVTMYFLLNRKLKTVLRNPEIKVMMILIPVCTYLVFLFTTQFLYSSLDKQIRVALFEVVTSLTTTGFYTVTYTNWSDPGIFILIILMLVGGGTCSTAGGLKQYRIFVMWKTVYWQIKRSLLPRTAVVQNYIWDWENKDFISDEKVKQIANYIMLYLFLYALGSFIIMIYGYPMKQAFFEFASAIGTVGISIGVTNPHAPAGVLWTMTAGMFLGRLEFFIVFTGIWKILMDTRKLII